VCEGLGKIAEGFAVRAGFFAEEAEVVGEAEHLFKNQAGLIEFGAIGATGPGQRRPS